MYLLDANVISEIAKNATGRAAQRFAYEPRELLCTSVVVSAEILFGFVNGTNVETRRRMAAVLEGVRVVALEQPVDEIYASLRFALKKAGRAIGANDMFVAAHALGLKATLVTDDRGFRFVPNLRVENWVRDETPLIGN